MSHTSSESLPTNAESLVDNSSFPAKQAAILGRANRQDLHTHLWREEKFGKQKPQANLAMTKGTAPPGSLVSEALKHTDVTLQMSKPLPTEPIRRVDLGFSHKPLDKPMRFHRGQECYIKKVPQAIVAPFRRNPPEQVPSTTVTPIHRASIATVGISIASSLSQPSVLTTSLSPRPTPIIPPTTEVPALASSKREEGPQERVVNKPAEPVPSTVASTSAKSSPKAVPLSASPEKVQEAESRRSPKTRSHDAKQDEMEGSIETVANRISLTEDQSVVSRMSKCQVEVCRLKDDSVTPKEIALKKASSAQKEVQARRKSKSESSSSTQIVQAEKSENRSKTLQNNKDPTNQNIRKNFVSNTVKDNILELPLPMETSEIERPARKARIEADMKIRKKTEEEKSTEEMPLKDPVYTMHNAERERSVELKLRKAVEVETIKSSQPKGNSEMKIVQKKRKRRPNKTGFPTKIKKKKPRIEQTNDSANLSTSCPFSRENIEILSSNNVTIDKNENIEREKECDATSRLGEKIESSICKELENKLETKLKRNLDLHTRSSGRSMKRLKLERSSGESSLNPSNSSSVDPSPASSDVESVDFRINWDEESDQDSLNLLPSSESSFTPSPGREKRKKKGNVRKTFLKAGLFSYDYKSANHHNSEFELGSKLKGMIYKPEEHPFSLLPPPYYCGRQLRQKREDYTLPFDVWSLYSSKAIPTRDVLTTWNYKRIKHNIYYDIKQNSNNYETPACHCKRPNEPGVPGCGDDCINRMTYTECGPSCHLNEKCSNAAIQKHLSPAVVERFMTKEKGWGIRTKTAIPGGTFIMEYLGEVVTDKEFKRRMQTDYQKDSHHYCLHLGEGLVIDGHRMGGECRFVNHSCKPNCEMQKWSVNGVYRMGLFSLKSLPVDEELSYDYNFSLFNPHEGQACRCNTENCRGVIGGKSQRVKIVAKSQKITKKVEEKKKDIEIPKIVKSVSIKNDKIEKRIKEKGVEEAKKEVPKSSLPVLVPVKRMDSLEQTFCREHSVLLPRNLEKIRKLREKYLHKVNQPNSQFRDSNAKSDSKTLSRPLRAAQPVETSLLETPDVARVIQLSKCFREILSNLQTVKDKDGGSALETLQSSLTNKLNIERSYTAELSNIEQNIAGGNYLSVEQFDHDILLLFQNNFKVFGQRHSAGRAALALRSSYLTLREKYYQELSLELGTERTHCWRRPDPPTAEDEIICPCKQFKDEGVMIQCEGCSVWQHFDCVRPGLDPDTLGKYVCDLCQGVKPNLDIPLLPQPEYASTGEVYFVSLQREDDLQVTLGMTVYVLRAFKDKSSGSGVEESDENIFTGPGGVPHKSISPIKGPSKEAASLAPGNYPTYKSVDQNISTQDMDIFRIERLWKNEAGAMFAFGYHYLRPHETFHEPTRRFFNNEVFRVPLYEVLPLDTIFRQCWVMDPASFCRGRPLECEEDHVYICEYRVDKSARLFNKISKPKHGVCTKYFAFHNFDIRIKISRTYTVSQNIF